MLKALTARGIVQRYDGEPPSLALDGVDLELAAGELVCVLGPNGSGKSTLLGVLGGVRSPTAGTVAIEGRALESFRTAERARTVASVPQVLRALPELSVEAFVLGGRYPHLGLGGRAREGDREAVRSALEEADAAAWAGRALNELSGGECQRVLIARALAQEARILLFDEPTASLDPEHQVLVFDLIQRLVRDGRAALIATHELNLAGRYADRVVLLDEGRVVQAGAPQAVLRAPILEPVFGPDLLYARVPGGPDGAGAERTLVVPWPSAARDPRA